MSAPAIVLVVLLPLHEQDEGRRRITYGLKRSFYLLRKSDELTAVRRGKLTNWQRELPANFGGAVTSGL
jgi:hypothetical protein